MPFAPLSEWPVRSDYGVKNQMHAECDTQQNSKAAQQAYSRMHFFADILIARKRRSARPTRMNQSHDVSFPFTAMTIVGHRLVRKPSPKDPSLARGIHSIVNGDFWGRLL
jgi:hypothetical protein